MSNIATRDSYGKTLVALGEKHNDIVVLDADLSHATKTCLFKEKFPSRHFNCGIAECNMAAVAAGLATTGFVPFISSFAMFAAGRAFEQIRNSIAYPNLNVKICATHGGISVGEDGASHQCNEDFALMRVIPNMIVICPSDDIEACASVEAVYKINTPVYMRFGRLAVPVIHNENYRFTLGKGELLHDGKDFTIVATGLMVARALEASSMLSQKGLNIRVINIHTIKPLDKNILVKASADTGGILVAEEHSIIGGLGEAVAATLINNPPKKFIQVGICDEFGKSGPAEELLTHYGLTAKNMADKIMSCLKGKK